MPPKSAVFPSVLTGKRTGPRRNWFQRLLTMSEVRRTRVDLSHLTDEQLRDIGLTRDEVETEMNRPIWDVPPNWRR